MDSRPFDLLRSYDRRGRGVILWIMELPPRAAMLLPSRLLIHVSNSPVPSAVLDQAPRTALFFELPITLHRLAHFAPQ